MRNIITSACLLVFCLPSMVMAQGLSPAATVPDKVLYDYRNTIELQDEFFGGTNTSPSIGELGWSFTGGTATGAVPEANRYGIFQRNTSATISTLAHTYLGIVTRNLLGSATFDMIWEVRLNTNDANTTTRFGVQDTNSSNPPARGIYFEKLDGDTNWFCVVRNASVETGTHIDSGVAITTSFTSFTMSKEASGVRFTINGVPVCGVLTTNIPSGTLMPVHQIINSAAAAKTFDFDFFRIKITGMTR